MNIPIITYSEIKRRKKLYGRCGHCIDVNFAFEYTSEDHAVQSAINLVDQSESSNSALHMIITDYFNPVLDSWSNAICIVLDSWSNAICIGSVSSS